MSAVQTCTVTDNVGVSTTYNDARFKADFSATPVDEVLDVNTDAVLATVDHTITPEAVVDNIDRTGVTGVPRTLGLVTGDPRGPEINIANGWLSVYSNYVLIGEVVGNVGTNYYIERSRVNYYETDLPGTAGPGSVSVDFLCGDSKSLTQVTDFRTMFTEFLWARDASGQHFFFRSQVSRIEYSQGAGPATGGDTWTVNYSDGTPAETINNVASAYFDRGFWNFVLTNGDVVVINGARVGSATDTATPPTPPAPPPAPAPAGELQYWTGAEVEPFDVDGVGAVTLASPIDNIATVSLDAGGSFELWFVNPQGLESDENRTFDVEYLHHRQFSGAVSQVGWFQPTRNRPTIALNNAARTRQPMSYFFAPYFPGTKMVIDHGDATFNAATSDIIMASEMGWAAVNMPHQTAGFPPGTWPASQPFNGHLRIRYRDGSSGLDFYNVGLFHDEWKAGIFAPSVGDVWYLFNALNPFLRSNAELWVNLFNPGLDRLTLTMGLADDPSLTKRNGRLVWKDGSPDWVYNNVYISSGTSGDFYGQGHSVAGFALTNGDIVLHNKDKLDLNASGIF